MQSTTSRLVWRLTLCLLIASIIGGCAGATVRPTLRAPDSSPRPDMIVVYNFATTSAEVALDRGVMATAIRDSSGKSATSEEQQVGHLVAEKLAAALVEELRAVGIRAYRAGTVQPTATTALLAGEFLTIDQGNQTKRVWVGFGLGGSELRTRINVFQNNRLVAQGETATTSSLKPGMLVSLGASGVAESAAPAVVGAGVTGVSEAFLATVEADARRTAKEVAKRLQAAYRERGWLPG